MNWGDLELVNTRRWSLHHGTWTIEQPATPALPTHPPAQIPSHSSHTGPQLPGLTLSCLAPRSLLESIPWLGSTLQHIPFLLTEILSNLQVLKFYQTFN